MHQKGIPDIYLSIYLLTIYSAEKKYILLMIEMKLDVHFVRVDSCSDLFTDYKKFRSDPTDLHLSGLESFSFDYVVKWPVSLVLNRKVSKL